MLPSLNVRTTVSPARPIPGRTSQGDRLQHSTLRPGTSEPSMKKRGATSTDASITHPSQSACTRWATACLLKARSNRPRPGTREPSKRPRRATFTDASITHPSESACTVWGTACLLRDRSNRRRPGISEPSMKKRRATSADASITNPWNTCEVFSHLSGRYRTMPHELTRPHASASVVGSVQCQGSPPDACGWSRQGWLVLRWRPPGCALTLDHICAASHPRTRSWSLTHPVQSVFQPTRAVLFVSRHPASFAMARSAHKVLGALRGTGCVGSTVAHRHCHSLGDRSRSQDWSGSSEATERSCRSRTAICAVITASRSKVSTACTGRCSILQPLFQALWNSSINQRRS